MLGLRLAAMTTDRLGDECSSDSGVRPGRPMLAAAHMIHVSTDAVLVDDIPSPLDHATRRCSRHGAAQDVQPRTICICVEDFGMPPGINGAALRLAGIARAHAIGCRVRGGLVEGNVIDQLARLQETGATVYQLECPHPGAQRAARSLGDRRIQK